MLATAVIGANYGDEGKGLVVDAMSTSPDTVVVRFNGGAQAGHTVVTPEGRRHIFHHHGAGSLRGAATYLSHHFILNPLLFQREHIALGCPRVMASGLARVTTPYDMMLNQWAEEDRGTCRHGSCGIGINETVKRYNTDYRSLNSIRSEYVPQRAEQLGVRLTPERQAFLRSDAVVRQYEAALSYMKKTIDWREADEITGTLVFEGAQGLLLDQDAADFPYVTHSKTGLANVLELCNQMGVTELKPIFVTRSYLTRHGAGPMSGEDSTMSFPDSTNLPNPWQHSLRFGKLDVFAMLDRIYKEVDTVSMLVHPRVAMTCADQMDNELLRSVCPYPMYESRGPTRATFTPAKHMEREIQYVCSGD